MISLSLGVSSKSMPNVGRISPGLTKLACPWILLERRSGTRLSRCTRLTPCKADLLPIPEAEPAAGEVGLVEDRVESRCVRVVDVAVARGVEEREPVPHPVAVVRALDRRHLRIDRLRAVGQRVHAVVAECPVELVSQVVPAPVAVARPAEVADVDRVRLEVADGVGPHQEPVLVELDRGRVVVVVQAHLGGVAGKDEVLTIVIGEDQVLAAVVERVQRRCWCLSPTGGSTPG